jgi:hypothetical protein
MADNKGKQWLALQALGATLQDVSGYLRGEGSRGALDRYGALREKEKAEATEELEKEEKTEREFKTWQETKDVLGKAISPTFLDEEGRSSLDKYMDALDIGVKAGDFDAGEAQSRLIDFTKGIKEPEKEEKLYPTLEDAIKDVGYSGLELSTAERYKDGYKVRFDRPKVDYSKQQKEYIEDTNKVVGAIQLMKSQKATPEEIKSYIMYKYGANPDNYNELITGGAKGIMERISNTVTNFTPLGGINRLRQMFSK